MTVKRVLGHVLVLTYVVISICALGFTLFRVMPPFGKQVVFVSYAMMAPFQGYSMNVHELGAEGIRADGSRQELDLGPYYGFGTTYGERLVRGYFNMFRSFHDNPEGMQAYQRLAQLLRDREAQAGNEYELVILYWNKWPLSPDGLWARRDERVKKFISDPFLR